MTSAVEDRGFAELATRETELVGLREALALRSEILEAMSGPEVREARLGAPEGGVARARVALGGETGEVRIAVRDLPALPAVANPSEVAAFAVSIEPEGGSEAPTGPIVLSGAVGG